MMSNRSQWPRVFSKGFWVGGGVCLLVVSFFVVASCSKNKEPAKKKEPNITKKTKTPVPRESQKNKEIKKGEKNTPRQIQSTRAGDSKNREAVYHLMLGGMKMGTLVAREEFSDGKVKTTADATFTIKRAGLTIKLRALEEFTEKVSGQPVSFHVLMDQSISKMEARGVYKNGSMVVTDSTGKHTVAYDSKWLFPYTANELAKSKGFKAGTKYSYLKFQPQMGNKGVPFSHEVLGEGKATFKGKQVTCHRIRVSSPVLPAQEVCVDDDFVVYDMTFKMGGMSLEMKLVKRTP